MPAWTLAPGDPLALTLAADFRLCTPDYTNDQIWEIETGGDPPAFSLRTTYGLRARLMRIFPRFTLEDRLVTDPSKFSVPPRLRSFYPNFLLFDFSPFPGVEVIAEYWIPDSHTSAGRITVTNRRSGPLKLLLELCGQLIPLEGQGLAHLSMQSVNVLVGHTSDLAPVLFLTGGPQPGPYPSLAVDLALDPSASRSLTWVQAALADPSESFILARRTCARPWEAEMARVQRINMSQMVEITTGEPDWDAAFALSQKAAFSLFFAPNQFLPSPSFVLSRQPDQGYSLRGDGRDYPPLWNGQTPLESYFLAGLLPGAPELAAGLLRNFLSTQSADGVVDWKPGLAGQRGRRLAAPLLATLAWKTYLRTLDLDFLREVQPGLQMFIQCWFNEQHDHDLDGFPEWDHPMQTGLEDNPTFTLWQPAGQGQAISCVESPALSAMACREFLSLADIAGVLGQSRQLFESKVEELRLLTETCWDASALLYHNRDRDSHLAPSGKVLGKQRGPGKHLLGQSFRQPVRLLVRISLHGESTRRPEIRLHGRDGENPRSESLERMDFQWGAGLAVASSRLLYTRIDEVELLGLESRDRVSIQVMDFSGEDISLFMPLWAAIPDPTRVDQLVHRTLFAPGRFEASFGIPTCPSGPFAVGSKEPDPAMELTCQSVHIPWNSLIGEGLLAYGLRDQAAQLTTRLMSAVIQNLKKQRAFYRSYHAGTAAGLGERNTLHGFAPLGLFLQTLGVQIQSARQVTLSGKNPFPWPVTVKYRGLTVTRQADQTLVVFPNGQTLTLYDPTDAIVSAG